MDIDLMWKIKKETNKIVRNIDKNNFDSPDWGDLRCEDIEYVFSLHTGKTWYLVDIMGAPPHAYDLRDYIGNTLRAKFDVPIFVELEW